MIAQAALLLSVLPRPAGAACRPVDALTLRGDVFAALEAWTRGDAAGVDEALLQVDGDIHCLAEPALPEDVARLHLARALAAARRGDAEGAERCLRALLALEPAYDPGAGLARPDSLLGRALAAAREPVPATGIRVAPDWIVDGRRSAGLVPTDRASLLQLQDRSGTLWTWYLDGEPHLLAMLGLGGTADDVVAARQAASRPLAATQGPGARGTAATDRVVAADYSVPAPAPVRAQVDWDRQRREPMAPSWRLVGWGIASAALGGAGLWVGYQAKRDFADTTTYDAAADKWWTNQVAGWSGYGLVTLGGGLGTLAFVRWDW